MKIAKSFFSISIGILICLAALLPAILGKCSLRQTSPISIGSYALIITVFLYFCPSKAQKDCLLRLTASILAFILSQFVVLGSFFQIHHHFWGLCEPSDLLIWGLQSIIYGVAGYLVILKIYFFFEKPRESGASPKINLRFWFLIILLIRLIYWIAFFPCVFGFDAVVGLRTFMDPECATCSHHPFFIQLIHGLAYVLGKKMGNVTIGFAIITLIHVVASSAILAYGLKLLEQSKIIRGWLIFVALIYAVFPLFPYLSVYLSKDGIFAYAFLFYLFTLFEILQSQGRCLKLQRFFWAHFVAGLIVCLSRHQGIIIFVIESVVLLLSYKEYWKRIVVYTLPVILASLFFSKVITPLYNVEPAGKQETYGTLFQQTAYCLKQHPEDITEAERIAINGILNCDTIVSKYAFEKTDAVKNTYKYNPWYRETPKSPSMFRHIDRSSESDKLKAYRKAWISMFLRHPLTHIEATAAVCGGFFYNWGQPLILAETIWAKNSNASTEEYRFWHIDKASCIIQDYSPFLTKTPIISWVGSIPYYNWFALLLISVLLYRKDWKGLGIFIPVFLSIGILLICPVAFGRYIYPIVMALPLLFYYLLSSKK